MPRASDPEPPLTREMLLDRGTIPVLLFRQLGVRSLGGDAGLQRRSGLATGYRTGRQHRSGVSRRLFATAAECSESGSPGASPRGRSGRSNLREQSESRGPLRNWP
jgi:hypothetical protein